MMQHLTNDQIIDYLHNALPASADATVYAHLEQCAACRADYDAEAALSETLRAYAAREEREMPPTLKAEIWARIREEQPSVLSRLAAWWRPAMGVPLAAALALAVYFGVANFGHAGGPSIDAAYYLQDHAALNGTIPFNDRNSVNPSVLESEASHASQQQDVAVVSHMTADALP